MSHIVGDDILNPTSSEHRPMTDIARTDDLFFARTGMDPERVVKRVDTALDGADDGGHGRGLLERSKRHSDHGQDRQGQLQQGIGAHMAASYRARHPTPGILALTREGCSLRGIRRGVPGPISSMSPAPRRAYACRRCGISLTRSQ